MTRVGWLPMILWLAVGAVGCTQHGPYRTAAIVENPPSAATLNGVECRSGAKPTAAAAEGRRAALLPACEPDEAHKSTAEAIGRSSIQHRHYFYKGQGDAVPTKPGDYDLA